MQTGNMIGSAQAQTSERNMVGAARQQGGQAVSEGQDCVSPTMPNAGFEDALRWIKKGHRVARRGWNGRGIAVYLNKGSHDFRENQEIPVLIDGIHRNLFEPGDNGTATRAPNLAIRGVTGTTVQGWAPSQTDQLAEDWYMV